MSTFYEKGIKFQCQGSGKCCASRGQYGYVYLTQQDRRNMAETLGVSTSVFTKTYCKQAEGVYFLKQNPGSPDCIFLKENKCTVYKGRPTQCRTWPFWPDNMHAKTWNKDIKQFCPGIGKGKLHSKDEINKILEEEKKAEAELFS